MNLKEQLDFVADRFISELELEQNVSSIDVGEWDWENHVYESPLFRHAHVEKFFTDNLDVLHVTIFPHEWCKVPIFGFDVVTGGRDRKILSAFMDMTPTILDGYGIEDGILDRFSNHRELPDWATMFSDNFLAIRPDEDEYEELFDVGILHFNLTLWMLEQDNFKAKDELEVFDIIEKQNRYCKQQWKNQRTMGALKAKVGKEKAEEFMTKVLFPKIQTDSLSGT